MNKALFGVALAAITLATATTVRADDWRSGLYVKGAGGYVSSRSQEYDDGVTSMETDVDNGYTIDAAIGYDYGDMRSEIEVAYRNSGVDGHKSNGASLNDPDGQAESYAFMLNGYYDIPTGTVLTPYIGAGIGFARVDADSYDTAGTVFLDDGDTSFAYQAIAGLDFAIDDKLSAYTEYKYFAVDNVSMKTVAGNDSDMDYDNHSFLLGLRYNLN